MGPMQIIAIVKTVYSIAKVLFKVYQMLERRFQWSKNQGPDVKKEIRKRKRAALDAAIVEQFKKHGLPEPDRETQAYVRERVHDIMSRRRGKTAGRKQWR